MLKKTDCRVIVHYGNCTLFIHADLGIISYTTVPQRFLIERDERLAGLRLFWYQSMKFDLYARTGRMACGPLNMHQYCLTCYLTLSSRDKMLKEVRDWNRTYSDCTDKETVGWTQVEAQMVRIQRDNEWRTRKEPCLMLSSSFLSWDSNTYEESRGKRMRGLNINFGFLSRPTMPSPDPFVTPYCAIMIDQSQDEWRTHVRVIRSNLNPILVGLQY